MGSTRGLPLMLQAIVIAVLCMISSSATITRRPQHLRHLAALFQIVDPKTKNGEPICRCLDLGGRRDCGNHAAKVAAEHAEGKKFLGDWKCSGQASGHKTRCYNGKQTVHDNVWKHITCETPPECDSNGNCVGRR